jgi:zinc D-Ala-D-Ala carboxypeptidase
MTQLTEHFTLHEMTRSETAARKGIRNEPGQREINALRLLCERVLEPVRAHFGKPVIITSGYRSPRLNTAIGGSVSSQHCKGQACDMHVWNTPDLDVAQWIMRSLKFDQLILEYPPEGWVHVSYDAARLRNMELTAKRRRGKTIYLPGLVP